MPGSGVWGSETWVTAGSVFLTWDPLVSGRSLTVHRLTRTNKHAGKLQRKKCIYLSLPTMSKTMTSKGRDKLLWTKLKTLCSRRDKQGWSWLMICWRKKSWNLERVPSVITLSAHLSVCVSVRGLQVTPCDLESSFWAEWSFLGHQKETHFFFVFRNLNFNAFLKWDTTFTNFLWIGDFQNKTFLRTLLIEHIKTSTPHRFSWEKTH